MSDAPPIPPIPEPAIPPLTALQAQADSLKSPTFIIGMSLVLIAAGTIAGVFLKSGPEVQNVIAGTVIGNSLGALTGYYFGAAKHPSSVSLPDKVPVVDPAKV